MGKYEYKRETVERRYQDRGMEMESPAVDTLEKAGGEGWLLCAVGSPDSGGVCTFYFVRELNNK
jgi:hypothetical protein